MWTGGRGTRGCHMYTGLLNFTILCVFGLAFKGNGAISPLQGTDADKIMESRRRSCSS
jgi:hypothetical protein